MRGMGKNFGAYIPSLGKAVIGLDGEGRKLEFSSVFEREKAGKIIRKP